MDEAEERDTVQLLRGLCLVEREAVLMELEEKDRETAERVRACLAAAGVRLGTVPER